MKRKILALLLLFVMGCEDHVRQKADVNESGKVTIHGKECDVVVVNAGDMRPQLYYIDCPTGTSVTYKSGKSPSHSMTMPKDEGNSCSCHPEQ